MARGDSRPTGLKVSSGQLHCAPHTFPFQRRDNGVRPYAIAVVIINDGFQRAQSDFKTTAFVAENVAPAANFGRLAVAGPAEATRAGAAEHKDIDCRGVL